MKKASRAKKWVIWLRNNLNHDDDEIITVTAKSESEARDKATYNRNRFSIRSVMTAKEWNSGRWV